MRLLSILQVLMLVLFSSSVFAHAIWIESSPSGVKGKQQVVRVYYGEYENAEIEKTSGWYSDLSQLTVYVVQPGQSRIQLKLTDKGDYFEGSFIPAVEGTYTIFTSHITKDLWEGKRFQFSSSVVVQVGKTVNQASGNSLYNLSASARQYSKGNKITTALSKAGKPLADKEVTIMAPQGWVRKIKTDAQGNLNFDASLSGVYVIEFGENVEETGKWNGLPFKETWQTVTTSIAIK